MRLYKTRINNKDYYTLQDKDSDKYWCPESKQWEKWNSKSKFFVSDLEIFGDYIKNNSYELKDAKAEFYHGWDKQIYTELRQNKNVIWKYELSLLEEQQVKLPFSSKILRVETVDGKAWLWALVNSNEPRVDTATIVMYKTGQSIPHDADSLQFLGVCKFTVGQEIALYTFKKVS